MKPYQICITIPAKDELDTLPKTLNSLAQNNRKLLKKTLLTINLNNHIDETLAQEKNQKCFELINQQNFPFQLKIIDRFSNDLAYQDKHGVSLARKEAIEESLDSLSDEALILWLDADTLVAPDYLEKVYEYYSEQESFHSGHVNFKHQQAESETVQKAIDNYELYLHYYAEALAYAQSPYAFRAIGSTIVHTKKAYQKIGGLSPKKQAGEDFYFLQHHAKAFGKIHYIKDAMVYPSARFSDRVPFGTGQSLKQICASDTQDYLTYDISCFEIIKGCLVVLRAIDFETSSEEVIDLLARIEPIAADFFIRLKLETTLPRLQKNARDQIKLTESLMQFFDGFQTLRLINRLSEEAYPKRDINELWAELNKMTRSH